MIRYSEAVLSGHPDKFCDRIADAIVAAAYAVDPGAYAQVEVATWSDFIWLSGGIGTRERFDADLAEVILGVGVDTGFCRDELRYGPGDGGCNFIDVEKYRLSDTICRDQGDPGEWTRHVNDQSIVIGWAGYDERVGYLPPEHFLAHRLREALDASFRKGGRLEKQGPDGKLLVRLREQVNPKGCRRNTWEIEQILVTVQQREETEFAEVCEGVAEVVEETCGALAARDPRWRTEWRDIELLVNPNGPLIQGGSDGDNGQTGRKLVFDYYGPRVPIGGGALSGKALTHIDRAGAYAARLACVEAVAAGEDTCEVLVAYAPGRPVPLDVRWTCGGRGTASRLPSSERFSYAAVRELVDGVSPTVLPALARGAHFLDRGVPWNHGGISGRLPCVPAGSAAR